MYNQAERLIRCAWRVYHGGTVTRAWLQKRFGVSRATAKRDLVVLERSIPVKSLLARQYARSRKVLGDGRLLVRQLGAD